MPHEPARQLVDFLPAIYRQSPQLATFLAAFEAVLFTRSSESRIDGDPVDRIRAGGASLDELIASVPSLIDPDETGDEFLDWLSQWAAVTLYKEVPHRRRVIAKMIPLYAIRGTRDYVKRVVELYVDATVSVEEDDLEGMAVGVPDRAGVGLGTRLGEDPFRFTVSVEFSTKPGTRRERLHLVALVRKVIDLAKPAYTHYRLQHNLGEPRGLVIAIRSAIGVDTILEPHASRARDASRAHERYVR